jgi:hypothetical protein
MAKDEVQDLLINSAPAFSAMTLNDLWIKPDLLLDKTADIVSGGAWGRRPHTLSEPALLVS